jgi:hypothetical protein
MNTPVLPFECSSVSFEGNTLRLGYVDWLEISPKFLFHCFGVIIGRRRSIQRTSNIRYIDMDDLLRVGIVDAVALSETGLLCNAV